MAVAITGSYKMFRDPAMWVTSSSPLNTARVDSGVAGDTNSAIVFGGSTRIVSPAPTYAQNYTVACTEEWNGSSWSTVNPLNTARGALAGFGTTNAAIAAGGNTTQALNRSGSVYNTATEVNCTEEYDGDSWSTGNNLLSCKLHLRGTGTQNAGIIAGGTEQEGISADLDVEWYDGTSWSSRPILNYGVESHAIIGNQSDAFIFGGVCISQNSPLFDTYNEVSQKEIGGISWSSENPLNNQRKHLGGIGTQNAALAFGGFNCNSPTYTYGFCTEEYDGTSWTSIGMGYNIHEYNVSRHNLIGDLNGDTLSSNSYILSIGGTDDYTKVPLSSSIPPDLIFKTGSIETGSIAQGLIEGGSTIEPDDFNTQITSSDISKYDTTYARDIQTLAEVIESLQWRNYPVEKQCFISSSAKEVFLPFDNPNLSLLTVKTQFLSSCATGSIQGPSQIIEGNLYTYGPTDDFYITPRNISPSITISATATPGANTTFIGWSTSPNIFSLGGLFSSYNIFETNTTAQIPGSPEDQTIYAIFKCNVEEEIYCYTTSSNNNDICLECQEEKTIYFNRDDYQNTGSESITWYEDIGLTITASDGYYYLSGSIDPIVYNITTGSAEFSFPCKGDVIYCS